jgi:RNA polymerase sigma-70 factor (ECF subfamily)
MPVLAATLGPDNERTLLEAIPRDRQAFTQLYNHYFPRLYAYFCYRVGRVQDAEDLVSEAFLKAVEGLAAGRFEWRHEGSFAGWLFRIAYNCLADHHRRKGAPGEPLDLDELPPILLLQADSLPEDAVLRKEEFAQLHRFLLTLSPRRQEIITLKFFGGLHNSKIAKVLGLDERTVASHLCRGLDDLHRKYLQETANAADKRDKPS